MTKLLYLILLISAWTDSFCQPNKHDEANSKVIDVICVAFDKHNLVALAEAHKLQEEHDFILVLIKSPQFNKKVKNIVVEFANALYQKTIDDYIAGKNIPLTDLRKAFRNTGFSPFSPWDAPVYERFFIEVRNVNQSLPQNQKLRIIAGDPPVNWNKSKEEIEKVKLNNPRDNHFANIVIKEVLNKNQKALLLIGGNHVYRHSWNPYSDILTGKVIDILEKDTPNSVYVIFTHAFENRNVKLESDLSNYDKPYIFELKKTWLGKISTDSLLLQSVSRGFPDGKIASLKINFYPTMTLEDLADAYLYFGDLNTLTASQPLKEMYETDTIYTKELARRYEMVSGRKFPMKEFLNEKRDTKYHNSNENEMPPPPPKKE